MSERYFSQNDAIEIVAQHGPGYYSAVEDYGSSWQPELYEYSQSVGNESAVYVADRVADANDGRAIAFAKHLFQIRLRRGMTMPVLVSLDPMIPPSGHVRLPHLVGFTTEDDTTDVVIWETLSQVSAEQWLGGQLPDQTIIEKNLHNLLDLKRQIRNGDSDSAPEVTRLLRESHRYLSILFVYQHADVFKHYFQQMYRADN